MMTIENVKKAEALIRDRSRIAAAKWNAVVDDPNLRERDRYSGMRMELGRTEAADEELGWAVEEFRKRKLVAIDAQLRELGVDPTAQESAA